MRIFKNIMVAVLCAATISCTDLKPLEDDIADLKDQLAQLRGQCESMNESLDALSVVVDALAKSDFITGVQDISNDQEQGYVITFVHSPTITIRIPVQNQTDNNGTQIKAPVISVKMGEDGVYYWASDGEYVLDQDGNRVPVGTDGKVPQLKIEDGKWYVSYDGEKTWQYLTDAPDQQVNGYVFSKVDTSDPTKVVLTLSDGQTITLPTAYESIISLAVVDAGVAHNPGDVITLTYSSLKNVTVIVDDSDVETSEVVATDSKNGTIKVQTRSGVSLSKQRAFIIFSLEGAADVDWRLLSFDSSMKACISDIK
jgi:hypothetical protein